MILSIDPNIKSFNGQINNIKIETKVERDKRIPLKEINKRIAPITDKNFGKHLS